MLTKRYLFLALIEFEISDPSIRPNHHLQLLIFHGTTSGTCNVAPVLPSSSILVGFWCLLSPAGNIFCSQIDFVPTVHTQWIGLWHRWPGKYSELCYYVTFVPNGWNFAFVLQNDNTHPGYEGQYFSSGASCEAGFYQDDGTDPAPNNLFAMDFDSSATSGYTAHLPIALCRFISSINRPATLMTAEFTGMPRTKSVPLQSP